MFKTGDKIKCIKGTEWCEVKQGEIYTFHSYTDHTTKFLKLVEISSKHPGANDYSQNWELVQEHKMNKPHKHAELIKAWADGKEVQVFTQPGDGVAGTWHTCSAFGINSPSWNVDFEFRIKPEPKPDVVFHAQIDNYFAGQSYSDVTLNMLAQTLGNDDNIRLVFDGETGKLKHVELLEQK